MADLNVRRTFNGGAPPEADAAWLTRMSNAVQDHEDDLGGKLDTSIGTSKGDIAVFNGVAWVRLPKGVNGQAIVYDSSTATGLKPGTVASEGGGGGAVGNIVLDADGDYIVTDGFDGGAP